MVSPISVQEKSDGSIRPCGDYQAINNLTLPDIYPLPRRDEIVQRISGNIFFILDLKDGYFQIPIRQEDRHKTAITTPSGVYQFTRIPFGLRNAASTFQRFMDRLLGDLEFVVCYIDDIIIYSQNLEEHFKNLSEVLERLEENGLIINTKKCEIAIKTVEFLGFEYSQGNY